MGRPRKASIGKVEQTENMTFRVPSELYERVKSIRLKLKGVDKRWNISDDFRGWLERECDSVESEIQKSLDANFKSRQQGLDL